jgi:outer membrane autotransporter protein
MQAAWDAGGTGLGPLFATLGNIADAGGEAAYSAALRQISPSASLAPGARITAGARAFANAALSCPQFEGTTAMLREGECVWATLTGRTAAQSGVEGLSSFRYNATLLQAGGQRAMGGGWFLGGSLAYENSRLSTADGLNSGRGQAGYAAVTAKYQTGPWLFAGAAFGGGGQFNSTRTITLPGFGSIARGSPGLSNVGGLLRATYTVGGEDLYLRPSMTLSLIHARSSAYRESGAGVLNLDVASASSTVGALTPALEVGGRVNFADGVVLRLFTSAGVSLLSSGQWSQESRLVSSPSAARFETVVRTDRLEVRLQYDGEYSANLTGHGGSLTLAYRF